MDNNQSKPNSQPTSASEEPTPELPHPPKLPSPEPPPLETDSPTSAGQTPKPHFFAPGHLDPPV